MDKSEGFSLIAPSIPPGHEQFVGELDVWRYARYGGSSRLGIFKPNTSKSVNQPHTPKSVNWRPAYGLQCKPFFQPHTSKSINWRPVYGLQSKRIFQPTITQSTNWRPGYGLQFKPIFQHAPGPGPSEFCFNFM